MAKKKEPVDQFAGFRADDAPKEDAFKKLNDLLAAFVDAEQAVVDAEKALKKAQEHYRQLSEFDIPTYMESLELKEFTNTAGVTIAVGSKIRASIGDRKTEAFKWLIKNKHGGIIKTMLTVAFNKGDVKAAEKLKAELAERKAGAAVKTEMKVEASTLQSFVRKELEAGRDVPRKTFGVFEQKFTKIKTSQK